MKIWMLTLRTIVLFATLLMVPCSMQAQDETPKPPAKPTPQPKLVAGSEILIDPNTEAGKELFTLRVDNGVQLAVVLSGVISTKAPGPRITFKAENGVNTAGDGSSVYPVVIPANGVTKVWVMVTRATTAGEFEVDLKNNGTTFDKTIKVIRLPFAVKLDETNPEKFSLVDGVPSSIVLKNDDPSSYPLIWRLSVNGQEVCGDQFTLAAGGLGLLQCKPSVPFGASRLQDLFKPQDGKGTLLLYPQTATGDPIKASPWKIIPIEASMSSLIPFTQQFWGYLTIVGVLLLGGLASLMLSQALPNRLKRLNVQEKLMEIARRTANLTSNVDSGLQVMLRFERSRLLDLLDSRSTFFPDFAGIATRCNDSAAKLELRIASVQQIDLVLGQLDQLRHGALPSKIGEIEVLIDEAKVLLAKTQPTVEDLKAADEAILDANKKIEALNQTDSTFGQNLAKRALEVKDDIGANISSQQTFKDLYGLLPGPYDELKRVPVGTTEIAPDQYSSLAMTIEKVLLMKKYVLLREGTREPEMVNRLKKRQSELLSLLSRESLPAMRSAQLLLREMGDDVYPERLEEVLLAKKASIDMDPSVAYDKAPLKFCICFENNEVNESAAREELACEWSFALTGASRVSGRLGDKLEAAGWNVYHYFLLPRSRFRRIKSTEFTVQATFRKPNGQPLLDAKSHSLVIEKKVIAQPSRQEKVFGDRFRTELLKLLAALFIAVFALVSGAKEQLLKLDILSGLIAVFLVGFGADTIKNLLTTRSETAP